MDKDVKKFVGHAWLDEHHDVYFMVELDVADLKEKKSRFSAIMQKEKDILEIASLVADPIEISQESVEKAIGEVGEEWETGQLVEYEGEGLEELENGDENKHYLRYGRVQFSTYSSVWRELHVRYTCFPKYWHEAKASVTLTLE